MSKETFLNINRFRNSNADNGMMTKVWGPPGWLFLHCLTFGYPLVIDELDYTHFQKRNDYKQFFYYLGKVFPCRYCRDSYDKFFKELPIDNYLSNRRDLCLWLYLMHNKVNDKLGIPTCNIPSFENVQKKYESYRAECKKTTEKERLEKKAKGCIIPADGVNKKSYLEVINNRTDGDYILVNKFLLITILVMVIGYFIIIFHKRI